MVKLKHHSQHGFVLISTLIIILLISSILIFLTETLLEEKTLSIQIQDHIASLISHKKEPSNASTLMIS